MEENGTIQQLSEALNQLLTAYEKLKEENKELISDKNLLENELENVNNKNSAIEEKLNSLSNETQTNSSQMDSMLNRISSILDNQKEDEVEQSKEEVVTVIGKDITEENSIEENIIEEEITKEIIEEVVKEVEEIHNNEQNPTNDITQNNPIKKEETKSIDLGRMQSLLNGFNN